jgi:hypothetical protein
LGVLVGCEQVQICDSIRIVVIQNDNVVRLVDFDVPWVLTRFYCHQSSQEVFASKYFPLGLVIYALLKDISEDLILDCLAWNNLRLFVLESVFSPLYLLDRWVQLSVHADLLYFGDFGWLHLELIGCRFVDVVELHPIVLDCHGFLHFCFVGLFVTTIVHLIVDWIDGIAVRLLRLWSVIDFRFGRHHVFCCLLSDTLNNNVLHHIIGTSFSSSTFLCSINVGSQHLPNF